MKKMPPHYVDDPFDTDQEALDTVIKVIELDGIRSFLDGEYEVMQ
jgi:hypothetical protein